MVETEETEREYLLLALRGYLEELKESGVDMLEYADSPAPASQAASQPPSPIATGASAQGAAQAAAMPAHQAASPSQAPVRGQAPAQAGQAQTGEASPAVSPASDQEPGRAASPAGAPSSSAPAQTGFSAVGDPKARLLFVMAGAGYSGEAGGLLAKIIGAMGFSEEQVQLLTFPPDAAGSGSAAVNRDTLVGRIAAVAPEVVVALGDAAAQLLLETRKPVSALRGRFHDVAGTPVMPSLHPEALLENQALKRDVWNDMQQVMKRLAP